MSVINKSWLFILKSIFLLGPHSASAVLDLHCPLYSLPSLKAYTLLSSHLLIRWMSQYDDI